MLGLILSLAMTESASLQQQSLMQACITRTAAEWSDQKTDIDVIVDAAILHCRTEVSVYVDLSVANLKDAKLPAAQAEKTASLLSSIILQMIKSFAADAVRRGRATK